VNRQVAQVVPKIAPLRGFVLRRKCACGTHNVGGEECEECRKKQSLQRRRGTSPEPAGVPPVVHEVLRSPGQPLDRTIREFMEPRFGHDFGQVRIHTGTRASEAARSVNALAFTVGSHIAFGTGRFSPESAVGRRLLAHELVHVVQQRNGREAGGALELGRAEDVAEREADDLASRMHSEDVAPRLSVVQAGSTLRRAPAPNQGTAPATPAPEQEQEPPTPGCIPVAGLPNTNCSVYWANSWWLPLAYANNATCACQETPNTPTAKCVRKKLQDRLAATPSLIKIAAASLKGLEINPVTYSTYQAAIQALLTPRIYDDHVDAYRSCCCPSGPASYPAWIGVTAVPLPCSTVGYAIRRFGSCHGTPGRW